MDDKFRSALTKDLGTGHNSNDCFRPEMDTILKSSGRLCLSYFHLIESLS